MLSREVSYQHRFGNILAEVPLSNTGITFSSINAHEL